MSRRKHGVQLHAGSACQRWLKKGNHCFFVGGGREGCRTTQVMKTHADIHTHTQTDTDRHQTKGFKNRGERMFPKKQKGAYQWRKACAWPLREKKRGDSCSLCCNGQAALHNELHNGCESLLQLWVLAAVTVGARGEAQVGIRVDDVHEEVAHSCLASCTLLHE